MPRVGHPLVAVTAVLGVWLLAPDARAEVYSYTDDEGVVHLTNIPPGQRRQLDPVSGKKNTYTWRDDLGTLHRVHRVNIDVFDDIILDAAAYYSLPPALVKAVVAVESSFEPGAVSHAGAQGLMQLIPDTARRMHVRDPFEPRDNIYGGVRYLRILANRFQGDVRLTLAAYNAGPEAVERNGGVPPYAETQKYVRRVLALYHHYLATWTAGAL